MATTHPSWEGALAALQQRSATPTIVYAATVAEEGLPVLYGITATTAWLQKMRQEQRVEVDVPVLVAPQPTSDFLPAYNPRVVTPFHVFVGEDGVVASRGPVGAGDWLRLRATWEDTGLGAALRRRAG